MNCDLTLASIPTSHDSLLYNDIVWLLGNLARASYVGSSDYMWPYSYNKCTPIIRSSQEINACSKVGHYGLAEGRGRGAPEIDVLETMQGSAEPLPHTPIRRPYLSCSYQVCIEYFVNLFLLPTTSPGSHVSNDAGFTWD